jgi:enoyl-CoA hydratase/carnithine racemase
VIECALKNRIGVITLNRPEKLNALNVEMFESIATHLDLWENDPAVDVVVIRSAVDRAFSAGGDLRILHDIFQQYPREEAYQRFDDFFAFEYALNERIHAYKKPYVALLHGIAMGGGLGVSIHGKYRVVSENVTIAMPECAIGFFPDIVSTAFLRQCPGFIGRFLGVTGYRLNTKDALDTGIATHFMPQALFDVFVEALIQSPTAGQGEEILLTLLDHFGGGEFNALPTLLPRQALIDEAFSGKTLGDALAVFRLSKDRWAQKILRDLEESSPLSLTLTYDHFENIQGKSFEDLKAMDQKLATYCLQHGDFLEGIRAKIIDKDNAPRWKPELG